MREFVIKLEKNWRTYFIWGLFWSVILVPLTATFVYISIHEGDTSRPHVPELRKIADETPLYPGAQKIGDTVTLKHNRALLTVSYQSGAPFTDVQAFFQRKLPTRGWILPKGPSNRFVDFDSHSRHYRRGDYFIALEPDPYSNNFAISFLWERD